MGTYHGVTFPPTHAPVTIRVTPTKIIVTEEKLKGFTNLILRLSASPGVHERLISEINGVVYQPGISPGRWKHLVGILGNAAFSNTSWFFRDKEVAEALRDELSGLIEARDEDTRESGPTGAPSLADELKKLAELRDSGVLTEAEFDAQKAKLLESG